MVKRNKKNSKKPTTRKPKYTLEELLKQCDFRRKRTAEERAWIDANPVGREIL